MSFCRDWSLVKTGEAEVHAKPLRCRSWNCEHCAQKRRRELIAAALSGNPERLLTLTVNPDIGDSPEQRRGLLAKAENHLFKRLRRFFPARTIEYFAVVERTRAGEPHLHILLRSPYIPQRLISAWMAELLESPIVDIRRVRSARKVAAYVAKYIGKAPAQFGTFKRYWSSRGWELDRPARLSKADPLRPRWELVRASLAEVIAEWQQYGYAFRSAGDDGVIGFRIRFGGGP